MSASSSSSFDVSVTIGGDAGQGIESSGAGFTRALARSGLHVFSTVDYRSRIRGGHNFYQIRATDRPAYSHSDPTDILLAMTEETPGLHLDNVARDGIVVYDETFKKVDAARIEKAGVHAFAAPLSRIAEEHGTRVMMNTAALGIATALLDFPLEFVESVIRDNFSVKGDRVVDANLQVVRKAHRYAVEHAPQLNLQVKVPTQPTRRMVMHGNHALALGAVAAGCRFISAYPMTPATSIFEWMTRHADSVGIVTKHAEDELAAICMAVGAGHAGARAMTATSGGGFSLMSEALGMAGMLEIPVVVCLVQRGGPSTGLPTRTEQGDLLFAWHASQGEFPRIILAPGTVTQCFESGWRAFNLAERYQCPVIVISDQFLGSSLRATDPGDIDLAAVKRDRGKLLTGAELDNLSEPYLRFRVTPDGISPRAYPGHPAAVYAPSTDEHLEDGHISESVENRVRQMDKRMRKLDTAVSQLRGPSRYGPEDAHITLMCWGSTYGPVREAVDLLNREGISADMLHFSDIWPFPTDKVLPELEKTRYTIAVEQNYESQFAHLLRMMTGFRVNASFNKYDGRPFTPQEIAGHVRTEVRVYAN